MGRIDETPINDPKNKDWYLFRPADDFFDSLQGAVRPTSVTYEDDDQKKSDGQDNPACSHGRVFRFNDNLGFVLIQFMRPHIWRIRFHHVNQSGAGFSDYNTRTIVQDTLSDMIRILDVAEHVNWQVELQTEDARYFILQSVIDPGLSTQRVGVQLWIQRNPFRITAVRSVRAASASAILPQLQAPIDASVASKLRIEEAQGMNNAIIWQTKVRPLQYIQDAAILSVEKPSIARYAGFGEQGGKRMFKDNVFMNYFNFDNMRYYNVYGEGPLKDDEPLYHSEPYWIEMNAHPGHLSQVGYFVDNYSQVCVDLGKTDPTTIRIATRFNSFQCIIMAGDDIGDIIRSYTSIIGRPNLKPRFILGNHQGCYGYDEQWKVTQAVDKYRQYGIPLDGMHVDVDIQRDYRTFTIDTRTFPDPRGMFSDLRKKGVKCSTNITPVINMRPDSTYTTLNEGLQHGYFVKDVRELDPGAPSPSQQRCLDFGNGHRYFKDPNKKNNFNIDSEKDNRPPFSPPDDYDFDNVFNSGQPFHGAVHYGGDRGAPGHYPNLNSQKVRDWWGKQYQYLFDTGLEFVWQDMTSPCMAKEYGDMRSFPFRLLLDSDGWSGDPHADAQKKAIEIWSLYSYNLHKATFQGLSVLPGREGKRNFIIGRGSFAGAQRYAGLWTGDNVSSWEFFDISVAQVLSLGLAGVLISGADVGGFEPLDGIEENLCADPELLIRWYCAYSLLPWFRNHYTAKPGKKSFQEPYAYIEWFNNNSQRIPSTDYRMWWAVLPVCRYVIQLRYSLLQLMYDAMFENLWTGLPIARAMIVTDPMDTSLYQTNQWYTRSQYLVRNDLLVAPALYKERVRDRRKLYLPYPDSWYPMNLRPRWNDNASLGMPRCINAWWVVYQLRLPHFARRIPASLCQPHVHTRGRNHTSNRSPPIRARPKQVPK